MNWKQIISIPYQIAHAFRSSLYDLKILKQKKLPAYTISIGNISFGGTGKTPITIAIAKHLAEQGFKVAVLTRGYKSKGPKPIILSSNSNPKPEEIGDEAMEMFNAFKNISNIILGVDPNRYRAATNLYESFKAQVFILDDGLQHLQVQRDLEIILKNINENGFYRELPLAYNKADYIIHTKVTDNWIKENYNKVSAKFNLSLTKSLHHGTNLGVFTAIGDPDSLIKDLQDHLCEQGFSEKDLEKIEKRIFPDHHSFTLGEVMEVLALGINVISTQKDLVKIPNEYRDKFIGTALEIEFQPKDFLVELQRGIVL